MSDIKHTASLEIIVYGKGQIQEVTDALKKANVQFENFADDVEAAEKATQKFGQTQTKTSKIVVNNASDAVKAIKEINEVQQKSIIGVSKATATQRKARFADISFKAPEGAKMASVSKAESLVKRIIENSGLKHGKELEESFRVLRVQAIQAAEKAARDAQVEAKRIAKAEKKAIPEEPKKAKKTPQEKEMEYVEKLIQKAKYKQIEQEFKAAEKERKKREEVENKYNEARYMSLLFSSRMGKVSTIEKEELARQQHLKKVHDLTEVIKQEEAAAKQIPSALAELKRAIAQRAKELKEEKKISDREASRVQIVKISGKVAATLDKTRVSSWAKYGKSIKELIDNTASQVDTLNDLQNKIVDESRDNFVKAGNALREQYKKDIARIKSFNLSQGKRFIGFGEKATVYPEEAKKIAAEKRELTTAKRDSLRKQQEALYEKSISESEAWLANVVRMTSEAKAEIKKAKSELAADKQKDRATEKYLTSMVPRQLQPFFRRGGLFMQSQYRLQQPPSGIFGGIRGALGAGGGGFGDRFGGDGAGGPSGPMRVIAYDALRRMLTEVYTMVSRIAGTFKDWIIEGVKFNDELVRAKTFFTSLGLLGIKGAAGTDITVAEASVSTNVKTKQAYEKSAAAAEEMMNRMMSVSALTGQNLGEIVSSARQSMTDLLNKVNKTSGGKTNAFLEDPKMFGDVSERMVKLASVLRMADPQNRKLSFHMVGLQELFSGSAGGKKDSGLQNVLSLLRREGIKIEKGVATEITKMVNKGDITGAMDKIEEALSRAGLGMVQLENMLSSTLQPAIDGAIMYAKIFNRIFTKALYENSLKPFFRSLLKTSDLIFKNKDKMAVLEKIGAKFATAVDPILLRFTQLLDIVQGKYSDPVAMKYVDNIMSTIGGIMDAVLAFAEVMAAFVAGLMGQADSKGLEELSKWIRSFSEMMFSLGATIRSTIEFVQRLDASMKNMMKNVALVVLTIVAIVGVISGFSTIVVGLIAPMLGFIWTMKELGKAVPFVRGAVTLLLESMAAFKMAKTASSMAPNINLLPRGAAAAGAAATAGRASMLARAGTAVAGVGAALSGGAIMSAITPLIPWIVGAIAVAGVGILAYNAYNARETDAQMPTANKKTVITNVPPVPPPIKKTTITNNPTINVSVTGVSGSPQQIGQSVANNVYDTFKSLFKPVEA